MSRFFTFLLVTSLATVTLSAQKLFTVQVGTFVDVRNTDFNEIKPLGFVYGNPLEGNMTQVYLGNYAEIQQAETVATQLRARGFKNALVLQRPTDNSGNVVVIQLTLQTNGKVIEWEQLDRAGKLFVENDDQLLKIMTGIYPDINTAQQMLPSIKELGYRDAFVKTVNGGRLIPIGTFETGIKKALIPIALTNTPPVSPTPVPQSTTTSADPYIGTRGGGTVTPASPAPATYGNPGGVINPSSSSVASAPAVSLPAIRGRFKRGSAEKLQLVLKEKGYYQGLVDGYYGSGTQQAYEQAWTSMPELDKYKLLSQRNPAPASDAIAKWPEVSVLRTIADDMSAGQSDEDLAKSSLGNRLLLYSATTALSKAAATRANAWELTLWESINDWATLDPLNAQIISAFRVAYFQSQVRLEDYYMDRGHASDVAKELAIATLQELVGADLERFL